MKRKIISLMLTLAMTLICVSSLAVSAAGEGTVKFAASNESVSRGDTLSYTVSLSELGEIRGVQAGIAYDTSKAEVVSYDFCGNIGDDAYAAEFRANEGVIGFAVSYEDDVVLDGDFAVIEFKILDTAASGPAGFGLSANGIEVIDGSGAVVDANIVFNNVSINYDYVATLSATTDSSIVYNNSEIVYELSLSELKAMRGLSLSIGYDADTFTLVSAEEKGILTEGTYVDTVVDTANAGVINVAAEYAENTDISGNIMTLTFKVNMDKEAKEYTPLFLKSCEFVTSESEAADLKLTTEVDSVIVSRSSYIEISYKADKAEINRGENVVYTVTLDDIATSRGFQAKLMYDESSLELVSAENGKILSDAGRVSGIDTEVAGEISFVCAYEEEMLEKGTIAVLTFKAKENASDGYVDIYALESLAVDSSYNFVDAESVNNVDDIYIGRKGREYSLSLLTDSKVYADGDDVYLTVSMGDIEKFLGVQFDITYDASKFTYVKPAKKADYFGNVMKNAVAKSINDTKVADGKVEIIVGFGSDSMYTGAGDICTLKFTANSDVSEYAEFTVSKVTPKIGDTVLGTTVKPYIISADSDTLKVIEFIDAIGDIETSDEPTINRARELYNPLPDIEKLYIDNYSVLVAAEAVLPVVKAIGAIGNVTLESEAAIVAARDVYELLSEENKTLVSNYALLTAAEAKYEEMLPVYSYSFTEEGGFVKVTVENNKNTGNAPVLITAQYSDTGALITVAIEKLTVGVDENVTYTYENAAGAAEIKCMLWSDMATMKPYEN